MAAFANGVPLAVVDFGEDPRSRQVRGLVNDLITRVQGARTHPYGISGNDPSARWDGYAASPQTFQGMNSGVGTSNIFRNGDSASIDSGLVEGPLGDPSRRIFAQRLQRRGWST